MTEFLYHDDFAGLTHTIDRVDDKTIVVKSGGDVQSVLDANKHDANHAANWSADRSLKHVARIPQEIYMKWLHEFGVDVLNPDHRPAVRKLLNSNEWSYLRTSGGRL
jgi:hypothetical protein